MQRRFRSSEHFSIADLAILLLVAAVIYGIVATGNEWRTESHTGVTIHLSVWALPYYTLLSAVRGLVAYGLSLGFTLIVGYLAAHSSLAEKIILPFVDILQSIPVLGFLPGLVLALVSLFPNVNVGLELAAIVMIFTGQVWNMVLSYYSSLKSIPNDLKEASQIMGLSRRQNWIRVELPFSAVNLVWNSLMSMAGGWFFLIPCEAMNLGKREYRVPGVGSYMDAAIKQGDIFAILSAIVAMVFLIISIDFVIWRPVMAWVQKFRLEDLPGGLSDESLMNIWIRESKIVHFFKLLYRNSVANAAQKRSRIKAKPNRFKQFFSAIALFILKKGPFLVRHRLSNAFKKILFTLLILTAIYGGVKLFFLLTQLALLDWISLFRAALWTFLRVLIALLLSTVWAVPVGIWIGLSAKRVRLAQPLIQILASFPVPMVYPVFLGFFTYIGMQLNWGSVLLILFGIQWYVLFNVLAGALRIPKELNDALSLMKISHWDRWKTLYLPSVFPSLMTGWMTAAGGAWNASVLAEYITYRGQVFQTPGLGATLCRATAEGDYVLFAASLFIMVVIVVVLNRTLWARLFRLSQNRFRLEV